MCYHASTPSKEVIKEGFPDLQVDIDFNEHYHISGFSHPDLPIITQEKKNIIQSYRWGLIPFYAKDIKDAMTWSSRMLNATCEKMDSTYKKYFQSQRCLIIVNGFFEWQWSDEKGSVKTPYYIYMPEHKPFTLAGIYNTWADKESGEVIDSFGIITTPANRLMAIIHNNKKRMPLIIDKNDRNKWLGGTPEELLEPYKDDTLQAHEITKLITARNQDTNVPEVQHPVLQ